MEVLERFAESRRRLSADPYRPVYHFVSPEGLLNDPNGLCFWRGNWHLFYQGYPPEDRCFSGEVLVEDDRVIAMYHGVGAGNMVAVSSDPLLLQWEKLTGQAVIPVTSPDGSPLPYDVFDPCIWKRDGLYYSLSGGSLPHAPSGRKTLAEFHN
jgi:beta-fructofuranosidase